jgi:hypothetical protein
VSEAKVIKNRHPLAIDAAGEREEEQEALGKIDPSRYVYKFRSFDSKGYTLDALAASHLWCSHFQSFNDIFEFRFDYDRHPAKTDEMFKLWRREFPQYADMSRKMVPIYGIEIVKSLSDDFGVCCFAKDPLNPLMWAYYAESHRGMCLAFEFADIDQGYFEESSVYEVHYAKTPLVFDLLMLKDRPSILKKLVPFVTTKHEIWRHEAEWRYVGLKEAKKPVAYPKESLKEVIFGARTPIETRTKVKAICESNGLTPRFRSITLNAWSYTLDVVEGA